MLPRLQFNQISPKSIEAQPRFLIESNRSKLIKRISRFLIELNK